MKPADASSLSARMWLVAVLLMVAEFLLFDRMTSLNHASFYPRWNDQIQYLTDAYTAYDQVQAHGLFAGLKLALGKSAAQGTLHDAGAILVFWLAGSASRSAALSLNMLVFLAWQVALLFTIPRVSGSRTLAWMAFGLVLCVAYPWSGQAGSAVDFRLDHGAMCLLGVTACAGLLADGFRSTRWSVAFGAVVGVTLLERFLTGAYFAVIFAALAVWLLCARDRWRSLGNLSLAAGLATMLALPVFWINRAGIYDYYWVGHITGAESTARLRGFDYSQSLQFVFENLGNMHLGAWFGWTVAALTGLLLLLFALHRRRLEAGFASDWLFLGITFALLPALILTFHRQKSEVVLGIIVPGVVLLVLWLWQVIGSRIEFRSEPAWRRLLPALPAVLALGAGGGFFTFRQLSPAHSPDFVQSAQKINAISDYIFQAVRAGHIAQPSVGIDRVVDFLDGRILRVVCYERHKAWVPFGVHLPDSILAGPDEAVLFKLRSSDFMFLTNYSPDSGYWPYDQQMIRLYPELRDWCDDNLVLVEHFSVFGRNMAFYQRQGLP